MRKLLCATTALGFAALAPNANAVLLAQYSVDGGATFTSICTAASGTSCGSSFTASDGLQFTIFGATSNSPGTATNADLLNATVRLTNPTATTETIELSIGDTGFTMPTAPPAVSFINSIAGTVVTGGATNAFTSFACLDQGNGQNTCPAAIMTPLIAAAITLPGSGNQSGTINVPLLSSPYSMTEILTITLDPGANINYSASADVTATPEPASIGLLGVGLLGLGLVVSRKRAA